MLALLDATKRAVRELCAREETLGANRRAKTAAENKAYAAQTSGLTGAMPCAL